MGKHKHSLFRFLSCSADEEAALDVSAASLFSSLCRVGCLVEAGEIGPLEDDSPDDSAIFIIFFSLSLFVHLSFFVALLEEEELG